MFAPTDEEDDLNTKMNMVMLMFPQGDFEYFRERVIQLRNQQDFENFVMNLTETDNYPKRQREVLRIDVPGQERSAAVESFRIEPFDIETFMLDCQFNPERFFQQMKRDLPHKTFCLDFVRRRYTHLPEAYINDMLRGTAFNLIKAKDALDNSTSIIAPPRVVVPLPDNLDDVPDWPVDFKREVQYFVHKVEVDAYCKLLAEMRTRAVNEKEQFECECCFADEIIFDEITSCTEGHLICIPCVLQFLNGVQQRRYDVSCVLVDYCPGIIPWESIQKMMPQQQFIELQRRRQMVELQKAELPDVEFCATCNYGVIPHKTDIVIKCPNCGYDTCRQCRGESHVPRKCYEPEVPLKTRYDEEMLTAEIVRKCPRCKVSFVKDGGCDHVTCDCACEMNYGSTLAPQDKADIPTCSTYRR